MPCGQPIPQVITSWRPLPLPCNDASTAPLTAGTRAPFAARRPLGGASAPGEMAAMAKWKENPWGNPWESYKKWRSSWKNHWKNGWIVQVMFDCRINGGFLILAAKLQNQERLEVLPWPCGRSRHVTLQGGQGLWRPPSHGMPPTRNATTHGLVV